MAEDVRYGIAELAERGGVSRRTVRFYVQEGLLPAPLGVGRGDHYGPPHLARLLQVKALQEAGRSLDEIRRLLAGHRWQHAPAAPALLAAVDGAGPVPDAAPLARSTWRRIALAPGVELHVSADVRLPSATRLQDLVEWCRLHLAHDRSATRED